MNKFKLACLTLGMGFAMSNAAQAAPITEFSFLNDAGFSSYIANGSSDGITPTANLDTDDLFDNTFADTLNSLGRGAEADGVYEKQIRWGIPANDANFQSSLTVGPAEFVDGGVSAPAVSGMITTSFDEDNLLFESGITFTHNNNVITTDGNNPSLDEALLLAGLLLDPNVPATLPWDITGPTVPFSILFDETLNGGINDDGDCEYGGGSDGVGPDAEGCRDALFVLVDDTITEINEDGDLIVTRDLGIIDGYMYSAISRVSGLEFFDAADTGPFEECGMDNNACYGFLTVEGQDNVLQADYAVLAKNVPEPASLAVFGLSLLGLAGVRRRIKK